MSTLSTVEELTGVSTPAAPSESATIPPQNSTSWRTHKGFWETVRNIGWVSLGRFLRMGGSLLVGTMVVRYLGPTRYGSFSYAFAIYGLFNVLSNLGLDVLVVSDLALAADRSSEELVLGTAFWLKAGASVLTTVAAVLYAYLRQPDQAVVTCIVALLSVASISQAFDVVDFFFQAKTQSRLTVIPQLLVFVASNVARVAAVYFKASLLTFGFIAAMEILGAELALAAVYWQREQNIWHWRFDRERGRGMLRTSWPLLIASLLVIVYMRTDQVLLGNLCSPAVVGQYASASRLSEIWYAIPSLICTSVMPRLLRSRETSLRRYYERLQHTYNLMVGLSVALALAVTFLGKYIVLLLFGPAYLPAVAILRVHIWTGPFVFIGVTSGMQLVHEGLTKISLQRGIAGAVLNLVLNYLLIPRFAGVGSAIATLATQAIVSYGLDALNPSTRHIFWMKTKALVGGLGPELADSRFQTEGPE